MSRRTDVISFDSAGAPRPDALGASSSYELLRTSVRNSLSSEDYPSGVLRGLRADFVVRPGADVHMYPPGYVVAILPPSTADPGILVPGATKFREFQRFIWASGILQPVFVGGTAASTQSHERVAPRTARRYNEGDHLAIYVFNPHPSTTWGAVAYAYVSGSVRVFPD